MVQQQKINKAIKINPSLKDHSKDALVVKKAASAKQLLEKSGLPKM